MLDHANWISARCAETGLLEGDPRLSAHTAQHLALGFLRDGATDLVADADGTPLAAEAVLSLVERLRAADLGAGDVIMAKALNDLPGVSAILAIWAVGATLCPVDPSGAPEAHRAIARQSGAKAMIESDGSLTLLPEDPEANALFAKPFAGRIERRATGEDLAMVIFTSGSSGAPKGVLLTHSNVMAALRAITTYLEITREDRILCVPPMFLDYGVYQLLFTMFVRCRLYVGAGITNPLTILSMIRNHHPTMIPVVPALASALARILTSFGKEIEGVRIVSNTGGHLAPATITALRKAFPGVQVVPMYGLTESKRALHLPAEWVEAKLGSVGGPMPGLDARVIVTREDGTLEEAADDEEGELYVRGSSVMQGYHSPAATGGARLIPGSWREDDWLATGDLFLRDSDGCLWFRGRSKALVKQRGYCLYPRDLEATAETLPEVSSAVMIGRMEPDGDESACLFLVSPRAGEEAEEARIKAALMEQLHPTLQPRFVAFLQEWPPSPVGKVDLGALRRMAEAF